MEHFTGTKPVAASHAFDVAALEVWLQRELPGFAGPLTVEQFKGGQSNPTYKLVTPQRAWVMRTKPGPAARLLPSAHAIEREFRVMRALGTELPGLSRKKLERRPYPPGQHGQAALQRVHELLHPLQPHNLPSQRRA